MHINSIGIIGLGLMGGSMALSLKQSLPSTKFIGYDHNTTHQEEAMELDIVDSLASDIDAILECDLIILAIPVDATTTFIREVNALTQDKTIMDLGSTKEEIVKNIPKSIRENFVATHPMTGTEKNGPTAAFDGLYKDKTVVLCDIEKSGKYQRDVVEYIYKLLKMHIIYMDSKDHDKHAAFISHMPHAISYALANSVMKQEDPKSIVALAGGGFKDMSRIAKSSPKMWEGVFEQNRDNVLKSVEYFKKELAIFEELLKIEKYDALQEWMEDANRLHNIL